MGGCNAGGGARTARREARHAIAPLGCEAAWRVGTARSHLLEILLKGLEGAGLEAGAQLRIALGRIGGARLRTRERGMSVQHT